MHELSWYISWRPGDRDAMLDGPFGAQELEAIAWIMRNNEGE